MDLWTYSKLLWVSASPTTFILILCLYPNAQSEICPNGKAFVKLQEWQYYEAAIKLPSMKLRLCFITLGHFLLLNSSPAAEASGRCGYKLTSPVLPGSDRFCMLQVALYEAGPAVGNLTLLIKPVLSGSAVHSVVLNHRERDDRRSANTLRTGSPCRCDAVWVIHLLVFLLFMQYNMSI